jgi:hypothetical protein
MGLSLFFVGPSNLLHFPQTLGFMSFGLVSLGFGVAGAFVPLIPEIVDAVQADEIKRLGLDRKSTTMSQGMRVAEKVHTQKGERKRISSVASGRS